MKVKVIGGYHAGRTVEVPDNLKYGEVWESTVGCAVYSYVFARFECWEYNKRNVMLPYLAPIATTTITFAIKELLEHYRP